MNCLYLAACSPDTGNVEPIVYVIIIAAAAALTAISVIWGIVSKHRKNKKK